MPTVESVADKQSEHAETTLDSATLERDTSKTDGSANISLENMESLLVNDDEDEDPLGTESLLMSGSEGEDGEKISPVRRKKRAPKILDSDDEDDKKNDKADEEQENETKSVTTIKKKISALIDSDSEPEEAITVRSSAPQSGLIDSESADEEDIQEVKEKKTAKKGKREKKVAKSKSKKSRVVGSASEGESSSAEKTKKKSKIHNSKKSRDVRSDSEEESSSAEKTKKKSKLHNSKKSRDVRSDSEEESTSVEKRKEKISNLIDSDSESSNPSEEENEDEPQSQDQLENNAAAMPQKKQQRASAKKAMDEMQALQSETQRLYRETQVSIPYHKPKRHTLKEFLTRRTIAKPQIGEGGSGKKLKMSAEELEAYAKHLEERAKEATEFFKSESEDEMNDNNEDDVDKDKETASNEVTEAAEANDGDVEMLLETETPSLLTAQDLIDIESEPIASTSSAALANQPEPKPVESKLSELKRRLIAEKKLAPIPTLKGGPNMIIDFETGDIVKPKPTGIETLFARFVKSNVNNKKPKEGSSVLTEERGLEIPKIGMIQDINKEKEPKPGAAYMKLKENLRTMMSKKRKEDFKKKIEENHEEEVEYNKCCGLDDDEGEEENDERERRPKQTTDDIVIDDEENEIELDNEDEDDEEGEDAEAQEDNEDEANGEEVPDEGDGIANEDDDDEGEDDDESESDEEEENPSTRKHRVIKAFEDSDEEKDDLGELDSGLNATNTSALFAEEAQKNPEEVENELLGLCSGQFEESQRLPMISQIPITQTPGIVEDAELMDLCSGVFNEDSTQTIRQTAEVPEKSQNPMKIVSSDEEKELEVDESTTKKVKKLKKKKKKRAKLSFSDDEDEDKPEEQVSNGEEDYDEEDEEIPQTFVDYDSEENEIEVQMSKQECVKKATAFLDKEAELSESEWGSADEDEQHLDKYDKELGDEDDFDREKIRAELGQIHMRKMLDDDIREVKKIQDMLFENEEESGVGRQRQFRWKNVESGFSLDDPAGGGADNDEGMDSADDEEEMKWRKMRFEREQLLKQKTKDEILAEVSATALGRSLLSTMESKPDFVYEPEVLVEKEFKKPSFLIQQCDVRSMRGSFLNYDKETLARIADAALKSGIQTDDEQVQVKASKTGNFVFAPLSEEEQAMRKRKAEEAQNAKTGNVAKKMKPNHAGKSLFLDKLL